MKIKKISIRNFAGIGSMTFQPDTCTVFAGSNGSGKTSILRAINFVLTGSASGSDIRKNADAAVVSIEFEDGTTIERKRTAERTTVRCNGKVTTSKSVDELLAEKFNISKDILNVMADSQFFADIDARSLAEVFLKIMPVQISFDKLVEFAEAQIGRKLTDAERTRLKGYLPDGVFGLKDIDAANTQAREDRKLAKREKQELEARAVFNGNLPMKEKEELEKDLASISSQEESVKAYNNAKAVYDRAVASAEQANARLAELKAKLSEYSQVIKPDEVLYQQTVADKDVTERSMNFTKECRAQYQAQLKACQGMFDNLDTKVCPLCDQLICTTDKTGARASTEANIRKCEDVIAKQNAQIQKCQDHIDMWNKEIEKYNKDLVAYTEKEALEKQIADFVIPEVPEKPAEVVLISPDAEQDIREQIRTWNVYEESLTIKKLLTEKEDEVAVLETICGILDVKNGVRGTILAKALQPLEAVCNDKLQHVMSGLSVKLTIDHDNGFTIDLIKDGMAIPMRESSTGETLILTYLLLSMVHEVSGIPYILIDDLDKLDAKALDMLMSMLMDDGYEHIFLCTVSHPDSMEAIGRHKNVRVFDL